MDHPETRNHVVKTGERGPNFLWVEESLAQCLLAGRSRRRNPEADSDAECSDVTRWGFLLPALGLSCLSVSTPLSSSPITGIFMFVFIFFFFLLLCLHVPFNSSLIAFVLTNLSVSPSYSLFHFLPLPPPSHFFSLIFLLPRSLSPSLLHFFHLSSSLKHSLSHSLVRFFISSK